jgi:hypothetical protein
MIIFVHAAINMDDGSITLGSGFKIRKKLLSITMTFKNSFALILYLMNFLVEL